MKAAAASIITPIGAAAPVLGFVTPECLLSLAVGAIVPCVEAIVYSVVVDDIVEVGVIVVEIRYVLVECIFQAHRNFTLIQA